MMKITPLADGGADTIIVNMWRQQVVKQPARGSGRRGEPRAGGRGREHGNV